MRRCESTNFGEVEYDDTTVITFPRGLPGFETEKLFVPVEREGTKPVLFLQSLTTPRLCFITLPVKSIDPGYDLKVSDEDLSVIGASSMQSGQLRCLAVVCAGTGEATANLMGPLLINAGTGQGVQAIRDDSQYSAEHPLLTGREAGDVSN